MSAPWVRGSNAEWEAWARGNPAVGRYVKVEAVLDECAELTQADTDAHNEAMVDAFVDAMWTQTGRPIPYPSGRVGQS